MKTLMIITPHMSTGGCPQVVAKKVELLRNSYNIVVIEWECIAWTFVVQRNRVINMLGERFISLSENKEYDLFNAIEDYNPDYLMIEEIAETFIPLHILKRLYSENREYKIFETTHSSHSRPEQKKFLPDKFIFVSPFSAKTFKDIGVPFDLIEYPIDIKISKKEKNMELLNLDPEYKHIINVGLFTPGKNQGYAFEIARFLLDYKIKFHFIGNQAGNFEHYWRPIMEDKPENCTVWGERDDVDSFLQASDVHLFTSNMELNPLSIKESLEYQVPTLIFDLPTYENKYSAEKNIFFLSGNPDIDSNLLLSALGLKRKEESPVNIKLVHILLDPDYPQDIPLDKWNSTVKKQYESRQYWEGVKPKFSSYVPRYNILNRTDLPSENCAEPNIINPSKELKNDPPVLSYGHYGCYRSNKEAIIEEFTEEVDVLVLIGGDVVTDLNPNDLHDKIMEAYDMSKIYDARMINLDSPCYLSGGEWEKMSIDLGNWVKVPHFLIGNVILIFKSERENLINKLKTDGKSGWHSFDIWLAWNYNETVTILASKEPLAYQLEGYSVLDYNENNLNTKKW